MNIELKNTIGFFQPKDLQSWALNKLYKLVREPVPELPEFPSLIELKKMDAIRQQEGRSKHAPHPFMKLSSRQKTYVHIIRPENEAEEYKKLLEKIEVQNVRFLVFSESENIHISYPGGGSVELTLSESKKPIYVSAPSFTHPFIARPERFVIRTTQGQFCSPRAV